MAGVRAINTIVVSADERIRAEEPRPVLFGNADSQHLLLRLFLEGPIRKTPRYHVPQRLVDAGLLGRYHNGRFVVLMLDGRHPASGALRNVLGDLAGSAGQPSAVPPASTAEHAVSVAQPLGHREVAAFRVVLWVVRAGGGIEEATLLRRIPDVYPQMLGGACDRLVEDGVLTHGPSGLRIADGVPDSYQQLVLALGDLLSDRDPRLLARLPAPGPRPAAFIRNQDDAPRLFGTDVRLRNLMALAKFGALHVGELKSVTTVTHTRIEGRDNAPFTRGAPVRTWPTEHGPAIELDLAYPVATPLRRLLLKLEERYSMPPLVRRYKTPVPPPVAPWVGDRAALFGGAIATSILMSIGVLGWTFEALCVETATGYDRVVVKKALNRLENDGIVEGERQRRPGFNVRVVRIADSFCAREELMALLEACVKAWPTYANRVHAAMEHLAPRTKEHLRRRGLIVRESDEQRLAEEERRRCITEYRSVSEALGYEPTTSWLSCEKSNLYRRIKKHWGGFAAFRQVADLSQPEQALLRQPGPSLRERCIAEFAALSARLGHAPNTAEIMREDYRIVQMILAQWGGFPQFCDDLGVFPARRKRSKNETPEQRRERCIREYRAVTERAGYAPMTSELRKLTDGLHKRILKSWPSFEGFCDEIGIAPRGKRRKKRSESPNSTPCSTTVRPTKET